ncbi:hypothetical protein HanPI659440_Chr13g0503181 [Helianthus annuus]|nr:hypothetical protein HanPI659440_Chr13g0503181 [Helianthus annuus]
MSINAAKQHMSFLASILESYESLVAGRIENPELTKKYYDQIDPEEMELIDIRWCLASGIQKAQHFVEITGRQDLGGLISTKLGFDKSKVTCFRCNKRAILKESVLSVNQKVADHGNPFHDDYYKKAIYHKNSELSKSNLKQIAGSSKEESQALVTIHDDEGFNWGKYINDDGSLRALVAEMKITGFVPIVTFMKYIIKIITNELESN